MISLAIALPSFLMSAVVVGVISVFVVPAVLAQATKIPGLTELATNEFVNAILTGVIVLGALIVFRRLTGRMAIGG